MCSLVFEIFWRSLGIIYESRIYETTWYLSVNQLMDKKLMGYTMSSIYRAVIKYYKQYC